MNPVSHELKGLVSFVKKAGSVKSLQYCFKQSGKRIFNIFIFSKTRRHIKDFSCRGV